MLATTTAMTAEEFNWRFKPSLLIPRDNPHRAHKIFALDGRDHGIAVGIDHQTAGRQVSGSWQSSDSGGRIKRRHQIAGGRRRISVWMTCDFYAIIRPDAYVATTAIDASTKRKVCSQVLFPRTPNQSHEVVGMSKRFWCED